MALLIPIDGQHPQVPRFLAPNATLVGAVTFGPECSVWFGVVIRADINRIDIGARCNIQDLACLHVSRRLPVVLGDGVSVAHGAIVHGCTIGNGALIGMGVKILDGAVIGSGVLVAAGCVVPEGMVVPDGHLIAGIPGRIIKPLPPTLAERIARTSGDYVAYQELYPTILTETAACIGS